VSALGVDVQDLYRFEVLRRGDVTLSLVDRPGAQLDLLVLNAAGRTVACACNGTGPTGVRQPIAPGRYFALVRAREHSCSTYTLSLLLRDLTTTSISASPAQASPGGSVTLSVQVSSSGGGQVKIEVERFDILQGWVFAKLFHVSLGSGGSTALSWRPPTIGRWRARASFLGTSSASPSESGYASFVVG
jgi:hypothetical protein